MKKYYYYKIVSKKYRTVGGYNVVAVVYTAKANKIIEIGQVKWNTASFKGEKSSVYTLLYEKKLVSSIEYKENNGYYIYNKSKVVIEEL